MHYSATITSKGRVGVGRLFLRTTGKVSEGTANRANALPRHTFMAMEQGAQQVRGTFVDRRHLLWHHRRRNIVKVE